MSCFMVGKKDIDVIVQAAFRGPLGVSQRWNPPNFKGYTLKFDQLNELGETLVKENLSSVHYRYPDTETNPDDTPGPFAQYWLAEYKYQKPKRLLTAVEGLAAVNYYEYQSCEHPEWGNSEAYRFCDALRRDLIRELPGYEQAPWGDWETVGA